MTSVNLTSQQAGELEIARTGLGIQGPFFIYYYYDMVTEEYQVIGNPTASTDGRRLFINPFYFSTIKPSERIFAYAHEMVHIIDRDPTRMKYYLKQGHLRNLPFFPKFYNTCKDYIINAGLIRDKIGTCNPSWLYRPDITGDELVEDVYVKLWKEQPPQDNPGEGEPCEDGQDGPANNPQQGQPQPSNKPTKPKRTESTYGQHHRTLGKGDEIAEANGGSFDQILEPKIDPVTNRDDVPDDDEYKDAIQRAAEAAKQAGNLPERWKKKVEELLEPTIDWKDEIRLLMTGKVGRRKETWDQLNKRRLAVSVNAMSRGEPFVVMPGRKGYGAENLAIMFDTSGSIYDAINVFRNEMGGIINDVKPRNLYVFWVDCIIHGVDIVGSIDEARALVPKGGGGTSFKPAFDWLKKEGVRPESVVYFTDGYPGDGWPEDPRFDQVIWAITTDVKAPWGETVKIKI